MNTTSIFNTLLGGIVPLIFQLIFGLFSGGLVL